MIFYKRLRERESSKNICYKGQLETKQRVIHLSFPFSNPLLYECIFLAFQPSQIPILSNIIIFCESGSSGPVSSSRILHPVVAAVTMMVEPLIPPFVVSRLFEIDCFRLLRLSNLPPLDHHHHPQFSQFKQTTTTEK